MQRNDFLFFVMLGCCNFAVLGLIDLWLEHREAVREEIRRIGPRNYRFQRRRVWKKRLSFFTLRKWIYRKQAWRRWSR
jgi:hypothetical protein